jgi:hypothetical protein
MAPFRSLRRRQSQLFGWTSRSPAPSFDPQARAFSEAELADPVGALLKRLHGGSPPQVTAESEARVGALESRYGIRIPEDFRRYLLGRALSDEYTDDEMTAWWSLNRIQSIRDEYKDGTGNPAIAEEADAYLFFADYLIWCWAWAICSSQGPNRGRIAFIGSPDGFVADSFTEFVDRYLRDPAGMANTFPSPAGTA